MKRILLFMACSLYVCFVSAQVVNKQSSASLPATQQFLEELSQMHLQRISPLALVPFNTERRAYGSSITAMALSQEERQTLTSIAVYRKQQDLSNFGRPIDQYSPIKMIPLETIILNTLFSNK
jgi:hypothetical protein